MATAHRRAFRRVALLLLSVLASVYAVFCIAACSLQDSMVFPRHVANQGTPAGPPRSGIEQHWLDIDGARIEAWYIPAPGRTAENPGPAVMFFHGNGALIDYSLNIADIYTSLGVSVLLPEYRGYGRSGGRPSEGGIAADMIRWHDWLAKQPGVNTDQVIYHGQSLGGGVAGALSRSHPPAALILHSTFTSITAIAAHMGVPAFLVRNKFHTDEVLKSYQGPLLIMHGLQDTAIPVAHGRELARIAATHAIYIEGPGGHNDYPDDLELRRIIKDFLYAHHFVDTREE